MKNEAHEINIYEQGWREGQDEIWTPERVIDHMIANGATDSWVHYSVGKFTGKIYCTLSIDILVGLQYSFASWQSLVDFVKDYRRNEILYRRFEP